MLIYSSAEGIVLVRRTIAWADIVFAGTHFFVLLTSYRRGLPERSLKRFCYGTTFSYIAYAASHDTVADAITLRYGGKQGPVIPLKAIDGNDRQVTMRGLWAKAHIKLKILSRQGIVLKL